MKVRTVGARFGSEELERLDELARRLGVSRSEALRRLVREVRAIPAQLVVNEAPLGIEG